jgi:predicted transposase YdaD
MRQIHSHQAMLDCAEMKGMEKGVLEGEARGEARGMAQGLAKGALNRALDIAKAMLAKGYSLKEVLDLTHLTRRQLASL